MLPDVLHLPDGSRAVDAADWRQHHRPQLLALFEQHVFGRAPAPCIPLVVTRRGPFQVHGGTVEELELVLWPGVPPLTMMLARPHGVEKAPCFVGLNFTGNHSLITAPVAIVHGVGAYGPPTASERRQHEQVWCIESLLSRGWAVATAFYGEIEPDIANPEQALSRAWTSCGADGAAVSSWAWQLQRMVDVLVTDARIDAGRVVAVGHSRLGKTSLWAAAQDERFAAMITNQSGCGGAAPVRGTPADAEDVRSITTVFGYWFCPSFARAANDPESFPIDHHQLLALCAPRPVIVSNAEDDRWADPHGQFRALQAAAPAWRLFDAAAQVPDIIPMVGTGGGTRLHWWWRLGPHAMTPAEWSAWLPILAHELTPARA